MTEQEINMFAEAEAEADAKLIAEITETKNSSEDLTPVVDGKVDGVALKEEKAEEAVANAEEEIKPFGEGWTYLKNPSVGESIELDVIKPVKKPGRTLKNGTTGAEFDTGLKNKKGERTEYILECANSERFTISSWGLFFQLFDKGTDFQKYGIKNNSYKGCKLKITHIYNGKDAMADVGDLMKMRDFKTMEEAQEHKKIVAKAVKDGTIYKTEVLNL